MVLTLSYSSPALTITGNSTSIKIGNYCFSETINTVSALTMTDFTNGSNSRIAIHDGDSSNLTTNNSGLGIYYVYIHQLLLFQQEVML
jgi:hypothetical protein